MRHSLTSSLLAIGLTVSPIPPLVMGSILPASAQTPVSRSSTMTPIKVVPGYGVILSFKKTGETIQSIWLTDVNRIAFSSNGFLCPVNQACNTSQQKPATVLQLKVIPNIRNPYSASSRDGSTLLTVETDRDIHQFRLIPTSGQPSETLIEVGNTAPTTFPTRPPLPTAPVRLPPRTPVIQSQRPTLPQPTPAPITGLPEEGSAHVTPRSPEPSIPELFAAIPHVMPTAPKEGQKPDPSAAIAAAPRPINRMTPQAAPTQTAIAPQAVTPTRTTTIAPQPARPVTPSVTPPITVALISTSLPDNPHTLANRIVSGLVIANQNGQIRRYTSTFNKAQNAIAFLRQGRSLTDAARKANVPLKTLEQLVRWGQGQ